MNENKNPTMISTWVCTTTLFGRWKLKLGVCPFRAICVRMKFKRRRNKQKHHEASKQRAREKQEKASDEKRGLNSLEATVE